MQLFSKKVIASKFAYTWYLYPAIIAVSFFTWFWGFGVFHQPKPNEKLIFFVGTAVNDNSFTNMIKNKFNEDELSLVEVNGCSPSQTIFASKLNVYLSNADIVVLPEYEIDKFAKENEQPMDVMKNFFCELDDETKTTYLSSSDVYYDVADSDSNNHSFAVMVKDKANESWLDTYFGFEDDVNYFALLTKSSVNTGTLYDVENQNDNALVALGYLTGGAK